MKLYTVTALNGDYAVLTDTAGETVEITVFLLPENLQEGETLACENFCYFRPTPDDR